MNTDPSHSVNPDGGPPHLFDKYAVSTGYSLGGTVRDLDTDKIAASGNPECIVDGQGGNVRQRKTL